MKLDIHKFSWSELFSNGNGKTSATAFCGIIICMVGSLCFLLGCIDKMFITSTVDVISQSIMFVGIGSGLLGLRKFVDSKSPQSDTESPQSDEELIKG
jgi:hypothetical protein